MNSPPRILITRTRHQASELASQLRRLGAETMLVPTIEVVGPSSLESLDSAIEALSDTNGVVDWLILTSANAVQALSTRAHEQGSALSPQRIAAIGPATAKAIEQAGLVPATGSILIPPEYVAESLAAALLAQSESPQRYLLVRAEEARDVIPQMLESAGHRVTIAAAYRNVTPPDTLPSLKRIFTTKSEYPDIITFTSSSTARNLVALLELIGHVIPSGVALASIGPITSATLRELGYEPSFEAEEPTIDSLVAAIADYINLR